ncbi:enoyl-CoA hydratase [Chelatococcus reniformis]|uniref:Enoyl-CoA hydratase n=1 Tax=Chelatococcus reniformis TaxID=1494448 RepID=A0A916TWL9_9HYPH|nr:enoyl-CoA hydratase [Chelatococcus reniformis]
MGYEVADGIARIVLRNPPVNALNDAGLSALIDGLRRAAADDGARAVLLTSAVPGRFSAGLDLKALADQPAARIRALVRKLYVELYDAQFELGKPSIAVVAGTTRGGGMTMAISCDVIIASESATFGYPEIDNGLLPAIHFAHLPRIIGRHRAFELLFSGRPFAAREAFDLGLVSRVVPDGEAEAAAVELARTFASKPEIAVRLGRAAFLRQNDLDYRRSVAAAVEDFATVSATEEARAGLRAFAQRPRKEG